MAVDASDVAVGACLFQNVDGIEKNMAMQAYVTEP